MSPVVRAALAAFGCRFLLISRNFPHDGNLPPELFEAFAAYHVFNTHLGLGLDIDEVKATLTGGKDDSQIDAMLLMIGQRLVISQEDLDDALAEGIGPAEALRIVIVQATMYDRQLSRKIEQFHTGVQNFFSSTPRIPISPQIEHWRKLVSRLQTHLREQGLQHKPQCEMFLVWPAAEAALTEHAKGVGELRREGLAGSNAFQDVQFTILGEAELFRLIQRSQIQNRIELPVEDLMEIPAASPNSRIKSTLVARVKAEALVRTCSRPDGSLERALFYGNVRGYAGHGPGSVNEGIANSLRPEEIEEFLCRNNGGVAIARTVQVERRASGQALLLTDLQYINGLQTLTCLHEHQAMLNDKAELMLKIVCTEDDDAIEKIVLASNSQNRFGVAELLSNHPFVRRLQQYCDAVVDQNGEQLLWLERRRGEYRDLAEQHGIKSVQVDEIMRAVISAFIEEPETAQSGDWKTLRAMVPGRLFNDRHALAIYHTAGLLHWRARAFMAEAGISAPGYPAKNHMLLAMRLLAEPKNSHAWPGPDALSSSTYITGSVKSFVDTMRQVLLSERSGQQVARDADAIVRNAAESLGRPFNSKAFRDRAITNQVAELARLARR